MGTKKLETVNIVKMLKGDDIKEGQEYYYIKDGSISNGTAIKCERCGKWCTVNSVGIVSFNRPVSNIIVADLTDEELGYDEESDQSLCEKCQG